MGRQKARREECWREQRETGPTGAARAARLGRVGEGEKPSRWCGDDSERPETDEKQRGGARDRRNVEGEDGAQRAERRRGEESERELRLLGGW